MQETLVIIFMVLIGAAIGGITNSLAIKMLFRPYHPVFIWGKRVPFTPGLIPKRRQEVSNQMGKMVVEHLLTPESIQEKLTNPKFNAEVIKWAQEEANKFSSSNKTVQYYADKLGIQNISNKIHSSISSYLVKKYDATLEKLKDNEIGEVVPQEILTKIEAKIPIIASYIIDKGEEYINSPEGKQQLSRMIDDFFVNRGGMLGNMMQMFLGNVSLVDKIQPELIKFLHNQGTKELIENLILKEWTKIKDMKFEKLEEFVSREQIVSFIEDKIKKVVLIDQFMDKQLQEILAPYKELLITNWLPRIVNFLTQLLVARVGEMMQRLNIEGIVRAQVDSFQVERIEEMILSISRKEFKMITYLGALLGGLIGAVQGIIVLIM